MSGRVAKTRSFYNERIHEIINLKGKEVSYENKTTTKWLENDFSMCTSNLVYGFCDRSEIDSEPRREVSF
jgi:hypothetical protein